MILWKGYVIMADIVNTLLTWFGYQTPDTIATFFDNIVRLSIGLGIVLFLFKGTFRLANIRGML